MERLSIAGPGELAIVHDATADGSVVIGEIFVAGQSNAFRWSESNGVTLLGDLSGGPDFSIAWSISPSGKYIVGQSESADGTLAFIWDAVHGMRELQDIPSSTPFQIATSVSDQGVVVGYLATSGQAEAFLWTEATGMVNLRAYMINQFGLSTQLADWQLTESTGISADGRTIVGWGSGPAPSMSQQAWVISIPEPSSIVLALGGLFAAVFWQSRREGRFISRVAERDSKWRPDFE